MFAASKTASVSGGYQISRSLRFNSADSAYLNRTPATTTNQKTWTFSAWIKRSKLSTNQRIFQAREGTTGNQFFLRFSSDNTIYITGSSGAFELQTTQLFRDPSAWYHIVFACDTTQATSSNRFKLYINGLQVTAFGTATYPSQNLDTTINSTWPHGLGAENSGPSEFYDGYMTEVNFIDGQALTPSSFGETNAQTGVWQPTGYGGTYGTNGFKLNFSDNSNTTAATLGADSSGNGNNWTPNNFSVTAGSGNDSMVDSPTSYGVDTGAGGEVRGNYATLNPLNMSSAITLANGNLQLVSQSAAGIVKASIAIPSTGKWYWEVTYVSGLAAAGIATLDTPTSTSYLGVASTTWSYLSTNGKKYNNAVETTYGATWSTANDVCGVAFDSDAGTITFYKNGTTQGTAFTGLTAGNYIPALGQDSGQSVYINFGQRAFAYTAPSGFKALCTQNLPTPTIGATSATLAGKYFNPVLYTGTGSSLSITGVGFQPDWTWIKGRSGATDHGLYDAVRGVQKQIESNTTTAETTETTGITAFGSDGFTTGALAQLNTSSATYVAWNWKANGTGVSNTSGSITSSVSANTTSGFSVVTYTGSGVAGTIGHGLGVAPSMIIVKSRSATGAWPVYHTSIGNGSNLVLNTTAASASSATIWNATSPTSSVFSVGINTDSNTVTVTYVAYCFAPIAGYSAFGSYTGNGSADGPFVFTGFRPAYILIKSSSNVSDWIIFDVVRNTYNVVGYEIYPNSSAAEAFYSDLDILSNGFKHRQSGSPNSSGATYIYMAFASNPFKYSLAR